MQSMSNLPLTTDEEEMLYKSGQKLQIGNDI